MRNPQATASAALVRATTFARRAVECAKHGNADAQRTYESMEAEAWNEYRAACIEVLRNEAQPELFAGSAR